MDAVLEDGFVADGGPAGNGRFDSLQKMKNVPAVSAFTVPAKRAALMAPAGVCVLRGAERISGRRVSRRRAGAGEMGRGQKKCGRPHCHGKVST